MKKAIPSVIELQILEYLNYCKVCEIFDNHYFDVCKYCEEPLCKYNNNYTLQNKPICKKCRYKFLNNGKHFVLINKTIVTLAN